MKGVHWIWMTCGISVGLLLMSGGAARGEERSWTANDAMLSFFGAVRTLQDQALAEKSLQEWVRASLECVLKAHDPYADYLDLEEYRHWQDSQQPAYGGIGLELRKVSDDQFLCFPYVDGPARRAGVQAGDRLLAIDDVPVEGKSLYTVGASLRGPPNTIVRLQLERADSDLTRQVTVLRARINAQSVSTATVLGISVLHVHAFDGNTAPQLLDLAATFDPSAPLVLDLRGNQGGDLFAAIDVARLFMPAESEIVHVEKRSGARSYAALVDGPLLNRTVVLLQNQETASAAEVLIAALTGNDRARSYGETSQGKGRTQRVAPLLEGGAMIFTDGRLAGPGGLDWNETGLAPAGDLATWRAGIDAKPLRLLWMLPWIK